MVLCLAVYRLSIGGLFMSRSYRKWRMQAVALIGLGALTLGCTSGHAQNLLANPGFDIPTPGLPGPNYIASITGYKVSGISSVADWLLWNNADTTTTTELLPSTDPDG